jgi:hypothetical protein
MLSQSGVAGDFAIFSCTLNVQAKLLDQYLKIAHKKMIFCGHSYGHDPLYSEIDREVHHSALTEL